MAESWWRQTVYPPRYFCGFLVVQGLRTRRSNPKLERIELIDAPIIPLSPTVAAIFFGERGGCYYSRIGTEKTKIVHEIQYAISVMDGESVRVEKFNHAFEDPRNVRCAYREGIQMIYTHGRMPLYKEFPISEIFDGFRGVARPVLQFIA